MVTPLTDKERDLGVAEEEGTPEQVRAGEAKRIRIDGRLFAQRAIRCGKSNCRKCPHGPYWHQVFRQGGREKYRYIGKDLTLHLIDRRIKEAIQALLQGDMLDDGLALVAAAEQRPIWFPEDLWNRVLLAAQEAIGMTITAARASSTGPESKG